MKLIQTKDYLLLVDSDGEITRLSYVIGNGVDYIQEAVAEVTQELDSGRVIVNTTTELNKNGLHKIIAYYPIAKEAEELDLLLLPNPFKKEIDETILFKNLGHECFIKMKELNPSGGIKEFIRIAVEFGYKSAQSDKQFSLEDMKDILEEGLNWFGGGRDKEIRDSETWFNHYIQSLSNKQLPKFFIPEENYGDGALTKYKTIINSEGREELVGTYKY